MAACEQGTHKERQADNWDQQQHGGDQRCCQGDQQAQGDQPGPCAVPVGEGVRGLTAQSAERAEEPRGGGVADQAGPMPLGQGVVRDRQSCVDHGGCEPASLRAETPGREIDPERPERQRPKDQDMQGKVGRTERGGTDEAHEKEPRRCERRTTQPSWAQPRPPLMPPGTDATTEERQLAYEGQGLGQDVARTDQERQDDGTGGCRGDPPVRPSRPSQRGAGRRGQLRLRGLPKPSMLDLPLCVPSLVPVSFRLASRREPTRGRGLTGAMTCLASWQARPRDALGCASFEAVPSFRAVFLPSRTAAAFAAAQASSWPLSSLSRTTARSRALPRLWVFQSTRSLTRRSR